MPACSLCQPGLASWADACSGTALAPQPDPHGQRPLSLQHPAPSPPPSVFRGRGRPGPPDPSPLHTLRSRRVPASASCSAPGPSACGQLPPPKGTGSGHRARDTPEPKRRHSPCQGDLGFRAAAPSRQWPHRAAGPPRTGQPGSRPGGNKLNPSPAAAAAAAADPAPPPGPSGEPLQLGTTTRGRHRAGSSQAKSMVQGSPRGSEAPQPVSHRAAWGRRDPGVRERGRWEAGPGEFAEPAHTDPMFSLPSSICDSCSSSAG